MCLDVDKRLTEEFSNKYTTNTKLTYYKVFYIKNKDVCNCLYTPFRDIKVSSPNLKTVDIRLLDVDCGSTYNVITSGGFHCVISETQSQQMCSRIMMNRRDNMKFISIPIEVWSDDVISLGTFEYGWRNIESAVVSKYKISTDVWTNLFK